MFTKRVLIIILFVVLSLPWVIRAAYADDAEVLPKGIYRLAVDTVFYLPIDQRFNPDGDAEDVAVDYNRTLDSTVFSALAPLDPFVPGLPSIGDSIVSFEYNFTMLNLGFQYGITDGLTAGITIPYWWVKNKVDARVDSGSGSSANVGINPCYGISGCPSASPIIPLSMGGTPLNTEDVQNLLGNGLDINGDGVIDINGFKYKRFETWSDNGLSDIEAGFKYQYLKTEDWLLAFSAGAKLPTGEVDDPDSLVDYGFGTGTYILGFRLNNDYTLSNLWKGKQKTTVEGANGFPGLGKLVLNGTFRYDLVLPDEQEKRVPGDVNNPVTTNKEKIKRDLGDNIEFEVSGRYNPLKGFNFSTAYRYVFKLEDQISGSEGFSYEALEAETARTEHVYMLGLSYTTVPLYKEKKFPVPLSASISYRNRFGGTNNVFKSQFITFGLTSFF